MVQVAFGGCHGVNMVEPGKRVHQSPCGSFADLGGQSLVPNWKPQQLDQFNEQWYIYKPASACMAPQERGKK